MSGTPLFHYKIPYDEWYIIVTSKGIHFYFNKTLRKSYWQLHDVFEDNPSIDKNNFINSINVEDVSILMSKVNGLKGLEGYFFKSVSHVDIEPDKQVEENESAHEEVEEVFENNTDSESEDEEQIHEYDHEGQEDFVRNLLLEEGYIKEQEPDTKGDASNGLNLGYSSSEDELEDEDAQENEGKESGTEKSIHENESDDLVDKDTSQDQNVELDAVDENSTDDENQNNLDLDLSISDDGGSTADDFFNLLDCFKDRISIYDPWFLVEEELLSELITKPEYYSINDANEREKLFSQWCKIQQDENPESDGNAIGADEPYPTATQIYYRFLQDHKKELKKLFYAEFRSEFANEFELSFHELLPKEQENLYRQYKIMITDYAEYEKKAKRNNPSNVNLKKQKLDTFLNKCKDTFLPLKVSEEEIRQIEDSAKDAFDKWAKLCNMYNIPLSVCNSVENFIVGDEKRLQSYIELLLGQ